MSENSASLLFFLHCLFLPTHAIFYPGRIMYANNEYPELGGRMRPRLAAIRCESDPECAGFTFMGSPGQYSPAQVGFFRFVSEVSVAFHDLDWTFYVVDRDVATYAGQMPEQGVYVEFEAADDEHMAPGSQVVQFLLDNNGSAAAVSQDGHVRLYSQVDLGTMRKVEGWMTYLNLHLTRDFSVVGLNKKLPLDLCCPPLRMEKIPIEDIRQHGLIPRVPCNMSKSEFTERFVRPMQPAILTGCDYDWLSDGGKRDLSLRSVAMFYHDNATVDEDLAAKTAGEPAEKSFTLLGTPNDYEQYNTPEIVSQFMDHGFLRIFDRVRRNRECAIRPNSSCHEFERFSKPPPIPDDMYAATGFRNDLDWVIISQENTGSHPHNDPDLTGAWNYLINGYKWWVIFPNGVDASVLNCDSRCSVANEDFTETYRWFLNVLPKLRDIHIYGSKLLEFVQGPGEAVYLPHGLAHAVLNVRDNVAVTENYLFADALPELMTKVALDEIEDFRPGGWDSRGVAAIYYSGLASAMDRAAMRRAYDRAVSLLNAMPELCQAAADSRKSKLNRLAAKSNDNNGKESHSY